MNSNKKKIIILSILASLLLVVAVVGISISRKDTQATLKTITPDVIEKSMFEFTGATGWRKGPSNSTSMALFNSTKPSEAAPCFTSTEYYTGKVDEAVQLKKNEQSFRDSGYTVSSLGTEKLAIQTPDGEKEYELHLLKVVSPSGSDKIMGGQGIGYLQLADGHLKIYGNCNTSDDLENILPALRAVKVAQFN